MTNVSNTKRNRSAGITSVVRAIQVPALQAKDYTYDSGELFIWTGAELATTIIAASIPVLRMLLRDIVSSTCQRNQDTAMNTFKNGTFRSNKGNLTTIISSTTGNQKRGGDLANIGQSGESVTSLIDTPANSMDKGGIMKTEVVTVNYGIRHQSTSSRGSNGGWPMPLREKHRESWV